MEDEREFGAFREDWDPLYASALADKESNESLQHEADWAAEQQALLQGHLELLLFPEDLPF